ncbi:hypothetical protein ABK040_013126 [Willaertia magna]
MNSDSPFPKFPLNSPPWISEELVNQKLNNNGKDFPIINKQSIKTSSSTLFSSPILMDNENDNNVCKQLHFDNNNEYELNNSNYFENDQTIDNNNNSNKQEIIDDFVMTPLSKLTQQLNNNSDISNNNKSFERINYSEHITTTPKKNILKSTLNNNEEDFSPILLLSPNNISTLSNSVIETINNNNSLDNSLDMNESNSTFLTKNDQLQNELLQSYLQQGDFANAINLLNKFQLQQKKFNILNLKLNSINLFANFSNLMKNFKLQKELQKNKIVVNELNEKVTNLGETIVDLNGNLDKQKETLQNFLTKYYKTIDDLSNLQNLQKQQLDKLFNIVMKEDITFDLMLFIIGFYLIFKNGFVNFILSIFVNFVTVFLPFKTKFFLIILKSIFLTLFVFISRRIAIKKGFHGGISSIWFYAWKMLQLSFKLLQRLFVN